jgi:hypothetical protein
MRKILSLFIAGLLATWSVAATSAPLKAKAVAKVSGGGTADFIVTPNSVTTSGFTDFSVGVTVYDDGTAQGHFVCMIPAVVTISGDVLTAVVNGDGSVTVTGLGRGYDHFSQTAFSDLPFSARFRRGGPAVGGFDYRDESGYFGPGQFDTEVIRRGMIQIVP